MAGLFVTGTDTGVGKTLIAAALCHRYRLAGQRVAAMKPVASGCRQTPQGLRSDDALLLQRYCEPTLRYEDINPLALQEAIAPHIAAEKMHLSIHMEDLLQSFQKLESGHDSVIVEGVGGWAVPLNATQDMALLATAMNLPVVLVVGLRLGCLNHALLTAQAIRRCGLPLVGWVANQVSSDMQSVSENIQALQQRIDAPMLARIDFQLQPQVETIAAALDVYL